MGTDRFYSKELNIEQKMRVELIKEGFKALYDHLDEHILDGREKSLYITKMEEACMWAVKAVSRESDIDA